MSTLKEDIQKLQDIEAEITKLKKQLEDVAKEIVVNHAPVSVGDTIIVNDYYFTGKVMVVDHIYLIKHFDRLRWSAGGKVVNKDGSVGNNEGKWTQDIDI